MNKNISKRKIVKYDGEDPQYIFDIIKEDPAWIERLRSGETRFGDYELNDAERHFYELINTPCPITDIRIDVNEFKKYLEPFIKDDIFKDRPIQKCINEFIDAIGEFNKELEEGTPIDPYHDYVSFWRSPLGCFITSDGDVFTDYSKIEGYLFEHIKYRFMIIRQRFRKGKISEEIYLSQEKLRNKLSIIEKELKLSFDKYKHQLVPYFEEWKKYKELMVAAHNIWEEFDEECHCNDDITEGKNYPSNETLSDLSSFFANNDCELDSIVFKISNLPDTKVLVSLTEKYPCLKYNIYSKENQYYISFSGTFENSTMNKEVEKIGEETSSEIIVKELLY